MGRSRALVLAISILALATACASGGASAPPVSAPPGESTGPAPLPLQPRLEIPEGVFGGGLVVARELSGREDVESVEFTYFDGRYWVILGRDTGYPADGDRRSGIYSAFWDVAGLEPGEYWLRAEVTTLDLDSEQTRRLVRVAPRPVGRPAILSESSGGVALTAAAVEVEAGGPLAHVWRLDDGTRLKGEVVEIAAAGPFLFEHSARSAAGALRSDLFLYLPGILLSLADGQVISHLDLWRLRLEQIETEKTALRPQLDAANQAILDEVLAKLAEARQKLAGAKAKLQATPPDEAGARADLDAARRLVDEARARLRAVQPQSQEILDNLAALGELFVAFRISLVEVSPLLDRLLGVSEVIQDKSALLGSLPATALGVVAKALTLLAQARLLLAEAVAALLATPPDVATARRKIDDARARLEAAAGGLESAVSLAPAAAAPLLANVERLEGIGIELGFLSGKLWLLGAIGLDDPHAGIPPPDLTRDQFPVFQKPDDVQMGRPPASGADDNAWDDAPLYHELDHYLLYQKEKQDLEGGSHWYDEDLSTTPAGAPRGVAKGRQLAWAEGWANFSSCAKRNDPLYVDEDEDPPPAGEKFTPEKDLEGDRCRNTGEPPGLHPNANSGSTVESSVSGILWDLFDGPANGAPDADGDNVSIDFKWIWRAINLPPPPENILDFCRNLKTVLTTNGVPFDSAALDAVFTSHGVSPPP